MADHRERLPGIVGGGTLPGGRVDGNRPCGQPGSERMHERLNPAAPRREVVGDDQDLGHRAPVPVILVAGFAEGQGRTAPSSVCAYQPLSGIFSTSSPVCGASISSPWPT